MYLDRLPCHVHQIGCGEVGLNGDLGYSGFKTRIMGRHYEHAISAHAPSEITFALDGSFNSIHTQVALNDHHKNALADFFIYADGVLVACAYNVRNNRCPRILSANIDGARELTLKITCDSSSYCFSSWIDPIISHERIDSIRGTLGGITLELPPDIKHSELCIVTPVSPNFSYMTADMLGSLFLNGAVKNAQIVLLAFGVDDSIRKLAERHNALIVTCHSDAPLPSLFVKTSVYSIARLVSADKYIAIDSDMVVLGSLQAPIHALDSMPPHHLLVARDHGVGKDHTLHDVLTKDIYPYFSDSSTSLYLPVDDVHANTRLVVNAGIIFGTQCAFLAVDEMMRQLMPGADGWLKLKPEVSWREQGVVNLAMALLGASQELHPAFNIQALHSPLTVSGSMDYTTAKTDGQPVFVAHFNGDRGKQMYENVWRGRFIHVKAPAFGRDTSDPFYQFVEFTEDSSRRFDKLKAVKFGLPIGLSLSDYANLFKDRAKFKPLIKNKSKGLVIDSKAGVSASYLALNWSDHFESLTVLAQQKDEYETNKIFLGSLAKEDKVKLMGCGVSIELTKMIERKEKYDLVVLEMFNSTKIAYTNILMSLDLLSDKGTLILHDFAYPGCDLGEITKKLEMEGIEVNALSILVSGPGLYEVRI